MRNERIKYKAIGNVNILFKIDETVYREDLKGIDIDTRRNIAKDYIKKLLESDGAVEMLGVNICEFKDNYGSIMEE